jgi:glycosyltransferase involved in cell wall biosynthesis
VPKVSIVIATFNRPNYLKEAIQSALSQTFTDFEILVCDDGRLEQTRRVIEDFGDVRIRHFVNPTSLGIAMNTLSGIQRASADVVSFLNDDDRWTPEFLSKCAAPMLDNPKLVLVFADHWMIDSSGQRLPAETEENTRRWGRSVLKPGLQAEPVSLIPTNSIPLAMGSVFRKSAVDWTMFSEKVAGAYDGFLAYCLVRSGGAVVYVAERLTEYRVHSGSASENLHVSNVLAAAYISEIMLRDPKMQSIVPGIRSKFLHLHRHLFKIRLRRLEFRLALGHLIKALPFGSV